MLKIVNTFYLWRYNQSILQLAGWLYLLLDSVKSGEWAAVLSPIRELSERLMAIVADFLHKLPFQRVGTNVRIVSIFSPPENKSRPETKNSDVSPPSSTQAEVWGVWCYASYSYKRGAFLRGTIGRDRVELENYAVQLNKDGFGFHYHVRRCIDLWF